MESQMEYLEVSETMNNITIQKATSNDIKQLQKIGRQTFSETFSSSNTEENMHENI